MSTKVYGASDDLIEFEGDVLGEVSYYDGSAERDGVLCIFSDGTVLAIKYCKTGTWAITPMHTGELFTALDLKSNPDSVVAEFADGLKWAYAATEWEPVR